MHPLHVTIYVIFASSSRRRQANGGPSGENAGDGSNRAFVSAGVLDVLASRRVAVLRQQAI